MKWLLITDNTELEALLKNFFISKDKNEKLYITNFKVENLRKQKKIAPEIVSCIIYSECYKTYTAEEVANIASLYGCFAINETKVISNLQFLNNTTVFPSDTLQMVDTKQQIIEYLSKNHKKLVDKAKKRICKNTLFIKGIPFTSDCFGTYIAKNKMEIVQTFLDAGMSVNSRDDLGTPMLNIACRNDNFELAELLLKLGAEINSVSQDRGYTAVMDAVWRGNEKLTRYLIEKGADLNTINKEGQTNLVLAVGANKIDICKLLAENGADPDVKDMMGMSAYNYATLFKKDKIIEILKPYHKE